MMFDTVLDANY